MWNYDVIFVVHTGKGDEYKKETIKARSAAHAWTTVKNRKDYFGWYELVQVVGSPK